MMNNINEIKVSKSYLLIKRIFDITLSFILLFVFLPVILICAILIQIEDKKHPFYSQERIGKHGEKFKIYKFRTMHTSAEKDNIPILCNGVDDVRLTKIGKFLRQHHLDELPQLFNVLIGNMSFVGWRPEREFFVNKIMEIDNRYKLLYQIKPGVTSYATLYNGYTDTIEKMLDRLEFDIHYLNNISIYTDVKILFLTFINIVSGKKF